MPRASGGANGRASLCGVTEPAPHDAPAPTNRDVARLVAGVLCALQALTLVGFVVFYLVELVRGASDDPTRVVMSAVLIAVFAALLGLVARAWLRGANWPNTPTIVWNVLLLPVSWSLIQGGWAAVGIPLLVVALAAVVSAAKADTGERSIG